MKLKKTKTSKSTLSEKIADALTVKPRADIEDDHVFNSKPKTLSRADFSSSDSEDDAIISDFRKRNVNLLSEISKKYEGQVVSRKDLGDDIQERNTNKENLSEDTDDSDDSNGLESDDYSITKLKKQIESGHTDESDGNDTDEESNENNEDIDSDDQDNDDDDEDGDEDGYDISQMAEPVRENFEHMKKQNVSEEAKKGACVRNQLLIWEGLLEMRIHLQRCMNTANKMPMSETYTDLKQNVEFAKESNDTISNVATVLEKMLSIQNMLFKKFPETKSLSTNKQDISIKEQKKVDEGSDEEIPSDTDNEEIPSDTEPEDEPTKEIEKVEKTKTKKRKLEDYEKELNTSHKAFKSFRDTTIQKWNEKTRIATAANIKNAPSKTILQQISYILSDRNKLIRRTQLKRSEYDIIGYKPELPTEENMETTGENQALKDRKDNDEYILEIFDDSDFYHQLLRELIECKSADISDPVQLSRQWIALQQMRSKMKRKVDTKATKGRRIKYVVHNKLVNYMAPEKSVLWTDESKNELYSSLFGKMFEHNNTGLNVDLENVKIN